MTLSDNALVTLEQAKSFLRIDHASSLEIHAEYVGMGDGVVKAFSLDHIPVGGSLRLYVNGTLQTEITHFTISDADITFVTAPTLDYPITASYTYSATVDTFESYEDDILERLIEAATERAEDWTGRFFVRQDVTEYHQGSGVDFLRLYKRPVNSITSVSRKRIGRSTGDGTTVAFVLACTPKSSSLTVYVDGALQTVTTDYTLSGSTVTFTSAPADDAEIIFRFEESLTLGSDYFEQLAAGRLQGEWASGYEYVIVYNAGGSDTRAAAQAALPNAVTAVLMILNDLYETRSDEANSINIAGVGSVSYGKIPSRAMELLQPLKVEVV